MEAERLPRGADPTLHTKLGRGGLSDVEWVAQLLQLRHAGMVPALRTTRTLDTLRSAVGEGLLDATDEQTTRRRLALRLAGARRDHAREGQVGRLDPRPGPGSARWCRGPWVTRRTARRTSSTTTAARRGGRERSSSGSSTRTDRRNSVAGSGGVRREPTAVGGDRKSCCTKGDHLVAVGPVGVYHGPVVSYYVDLAIGLVLAFLLLSLLVSGLNEGVVRLLGIRSKFLWAYLRDTLDGGEQINRVSTLMRWLDRRLRGVSALGRRLRSALADLLPPLRNATRSRLPATVLGVFVKLPFGKDPRPKFGPTPAPVDIAPRDPRTGPRPPEGEPFTDLLHERLQEIDEARQGKTSIAEIPPSRFSVALLEIASERGGVDALLAELKRLDSRSTARWRACGPRPASTWRPSARASKTGSTARWNG